MKRIVAGVLALSLLFPLGLIAGSKPGGFSSGGRSYSGGGSSVKPSFSPSPKPSVIPSPKPTPSPSPTVKPVINGGKAYSGIPSPTKGSSAVKPASASPNKVSPSQKPAAVTIDKDALRDYHTVESRTAYKTSLNKGESPKTEYKDPSGTTVKIDPKDKRVESIRNVPHESWANRESRIHSCYNVYYNRPPIFPTAVVYHDSYNTLFWYLLLDKTLDQRALWLYNHHDTVDPQRYQYLVSRDAQLEARIKQLEREKVVRDVNYTPPGVDQDLQYDDSFVDAVVNPHINAPSNSVSSNNTNVSLAGLGWFVLIMVILGCTGLLIYGVFFYEY
jgi:hypothetical protein